MFKLARRTRWTGWAARKPSLLRPFPTLGLEQLEVRDTPATFTWTGLGADPNWATGANWQGGVAPRGLEANVEDLVFPAGPTQLATVNNITNGKFNSITFGGSGYTLSGNPLTLGGIAGVSQSGSLVATTGTANNTVGMNVTLGAATNNFQTFSILTSARVTVAGSLSGNAGSTLTKDGPGTLVLAGDNKGLAGFIRLNNNAGEVVAAHLNALGTTAGDTTVGAGASVRVALPDASGTIREPITLNGLGVANDGALSVLSGNVTWAGAAKLDSDAALGASAGAVLNLTGVVSDSATGFSLFKEGPGEVRLASLTGNTYRRQTFVEDGVLTVTHPRSLGADGTTLSGTVVTISPTKAGQLRLADLNPTSADGNPGGYTIRDEFLTLNGLGRDELENKGALQNVLGDNYWAGPVTLGSPLPNLAIAAAVGAAADSRLTISGVVGSPNGPLALVKLDAGRVVLDNRNTFTGTTAVAQGALTLRDSNALGTIGGTTGVEVQAVRVFGSSGFFSLVFDGRQTPNLPAGATAAQVEAALNALSSVNGIGRVSVLKTPTDGGSQYTLLFGAGFVGQNVGQAFVVPSGAAGSDEFTVRDGGGSAAAVLEGGTLELEVEAGDATLPQFDAHGRNLGNDSVTNDPHRLQVSEPITIFGRGAGATQSGRVGGLGALRSVSGINRYLAPIELGAAPNVADAIGVDIDRRQGHPTPDASYFTSDYSLTTAGVIFGNPDIDLNRKTDFVKRGAGQLVLPIANTYLGTTRVEEGWVTVQHNNSLGGRTPGTVETAPNGATYLRGYGDAAQPPTVVTPGAAVHLRPLAAGTNLTLAENFNIGGVGPAHAYNFISQRGALMSLDGNNVITGDVGLLGQAGVGVEQVVGGSRSDLVVTGTLRDGRNFFDLNANGGQAEQRFTLETGGTSGTVTVNYDFFNVPDRLVAYYPPQADGGALIFDTGIVNGARSVTFPFGPGTSTRVELVMNPGGNTNPGTVWELSAVTQVGGGLIKFGSKRLNLQGEGTYGGATEVREGVLRAQNDTALGRQFSGTATTQGSYTQTSTFVSPAAVLELTGGVESQNGGVAAGTQVYYEHLFLNNPGVQVAVAGSLVPGFIGTFTLTYNNGSASAQYTFPITAPAADVQTALNAPGSLAAADFAAFGGITVTRAGNVYLVRFGNTRAPGVLPAPAAGKKSLTATAAGGAEVAVSGGPAALAVGTSTRSDDNAWRGPITLQGGARIEVGTRSRLSVFGSIDDGAAATPAPAAADLAKRGPGELLLAGANTHRGRTLIDEGVVTAANSDAFGAGDGRDDAGTVVKQGAQLQLQGSLSVGGEALTLEGAGPSQVSAFEGTVRWLNTGPAPVNNSTAGNNLPTTGRVTSVVADPSDPNVIYVATAGGGAWKTKDGGVTWNPLLDLAPDQAGFIYGGSFAVSLADPRYVYFATGEANGYPGGTPIPGQPANFAGSGVYKSADGGQTWTLLTTAAGANPLFGQAVSKILVDPDNRDRVYVASGTSNTLNADPNAIPGVYRHDGTTWVNLTGGASPQRINTPGQAPFTNNPGDVGPPGTPGPDDDYRMAFPQRNAFWSDIALVKRSQNNGNAPGTGPSGNPNGTPVGSEYVLYAALGESTQQFFLNTRPITPAVLNAVYRTEDPDTTTSNPTWWIGQGSVFPRAPIGGPVISGGALPNPIPDRRNNPFPIRSVTPDPLPPGRNGWIKLAATLNNFVQPSGLITNYLLFGVINAHISVYASIVRPDWQDRKGELLEVQRSGWDGGIATQWNRTGGDGSDPQQPFGTATWDATLPQPPIYYRNIVSGTGRYNNALVVRSYSSMASAEQSPLQNQDELYLAGQDGLFRTVNGGQSWTRVDNDPALAGNRPADQYHSLSFDYLGRLLAGTDGGVFRYDRTGPTPTFTDLGGDLAAVQLNSADAHPTDYNRAIAGAADNGTLRYGNGLAWNAPEDTIGGNTGVVRYNSLDPNIVYAVRNGQLLKSTNGGVNWGVIRDVTNGSAPAGATPSLNWALFFDPWYRWQASNLDNVEPYGSAGTVGKFDNYDRNDFTNYFPLVVDRQNPQRLLIGNEKPTYVGNPIGGNVSDILFNSLYESNDGGGTWTNLNAGIAVSAIGVATFQGPFALDPVPNVLGNSPPGFPNVPDKGANTYDPDTIYVAGYVQDTDFEQSNRREVLRVSKDHGTSWVERTPPGATPTDPAPITSITVDPANRDIVYVTRSRRYGDAGGRVFRSVDAGRTWDDITGNDPDLQAPAYTTAVDPRDGSLYLGNENGVWVLRNAGGTASSIWTPYGAGLPRVAVRDIVLNQTLNTLTAATYGRGMFQLLMTDYQPNTGALRAVSGTSVWTGNVTLTGDTTIGASGNQALQNGYAAAAVNLIGPVADGVPAGAAKPTLTKVGLGTLTLSGVNTYGGRTLVREGVLQVNNPRALGAFDPLGAVNPTANTVVSTGAALELRSDLEAEAVTINGRGFAFNQRFTGSFRNVSSNNVYTGPLTLGTDATIGVDSGTSLTVGTSPILNGIGTITDGTNNFDLDKEGVGTLVLAGANSYDGLTRVAAGALRVQDDDALGSTGLTGVTGPTGGRVDTQVLDGAQLQIARKLVNGDPVPTAVEDEALLLSGTGVSRTGALLNVHPDADPRGSVNEWRGPVTFNLDPNFAPPTVPSSQVSVGVSNEQDTLVLDGAIDQVTTQASFGLVKVGPGRLTLARANGYTGVTNVDAGTLSVRDGGALGPRVSTEVQTVAVVGSVDPATGKTFQFSLSFKGQSTALLDASTLTAAVVRSKLGALSTIGGANNLLVAESPTGTGKTFTITFRGPLLNIDQPLLVAGNVPAGLAVNVSEAQKGGLGTVVAAGATLELAADPAGGFGVDEVLSLSGDGVNLAGALLNASGANTYSGPITLEADATVGAADGTTLSVTGTVRDPSPVPVPAPQLRKAGEGVVELRTANPYAGLTRVDEGILRVFNPNSLGNSGAEVQLVQVTGTNGTYTLAYQVSPTRVQRTGDIRFDATAADIQAALSLLPAIGPGGVVVDVPADPPSSPGNLFFRVTFAGRLGGSDQPQLTAASTGATNVFVNTLREGPGATVVNNGATLQVAGGITMDKEAVTIIGQGAIDPELNRRLGALVNYAGDNVWAAPLTLGGPAAVGTHEPTQVFSFVAPITDNGAVFGLDILGPGTVSFDGTADNTYTGATTVREGTLRLNQPSGIAVGGPLVVGDGTTATPAVARATRDDQVADTSPVTVNANGTYDLNGRADTVAELTVNAGQVLTGDGGDLTAAGVTMTGGAVTVGAGGTLTALGAVRMTGGTITARANAAVTTGNLSMTGGLVALTAASAALNLGGTLAATSTAAGPASVTGPGALNLGGAARTFDVADGPQATDLSVTAVPSAAAGDLLVKAGPGRLVLNPTATSGVPARVDAGDLQVDGNIGKVVLAGAGATLSGIGSVDAVNEGGGPVAVGVVSPGQNARLNPAGILRVVPQVVPPAGTPTVAWGPGTTFFVNLDASRHPNPVPGTDHDQLQVTGRIELGGAKLDGTFGPGVLFGDLFTIITASRVAGKFAQTNGQDIVFIADANGQPQKFDIVYSDTSVVLEKVRSDVTVALSSSRNPSTLREEVVFTATVTPEPGAGAIPTADTVTFTVDGIPYGPFPLNPDGTVTLSSSLVAGGFLAGGTHAVTARFNGDALNFNPGDAAPLTQTVEVPAIAPLTRTPDLISPNNPSSVGVRDVVTATTRVTGERGQTSWKVEVRVLNVPGSVPGYAPGTVVRTLTAFAPPGPGATPNPVPRKASPGADNGFNIAVAWDGRLDPTRLPSGVVVPGAFVPDGEYTLTASFLDQFDNTASTAPVPVTVDNTSPTADPSPGTSSPVIAPAPAGLPAGTTSQVPASTRFRGTVGDDNLDHWTVKVLRTDLAPTDPLAEVRRYVGPAGERQVDVTWDGKDAAGNVVPDGVYSLVIEALDLAGNVTTPAAASVVVLDHPPAITVTSNGPTTYGQRMTFTATVALPFDYPLTQQPLLDLAARLGTGVTVQFFSGTTPLGSGTLSDPDGDGRFTATLADVRTFNAGSYPITAAYPGTVNFLPGRSDPFTHVVLPAVLTVQADDAAKVYGQPVPPLTYRVSGLVNEDTEAAVVSGQLTTPATEASAVGTYPIVQGSLTTNGNYTVDYKPGVLTVTPAPLTVRVNNATRVFNRPNPAFTATYEGLLLGDTPQAVLPNLELVTTAAQRSKVGSYPITAKGTPTAQNYTVAVVPGVLTITPIPSEILVGTGPGAAATVTRYDPDGKAFETLTPFGSFAGGVRTATADLNGDGVEDVVMGTGPGTQARVLVVDGNSGAELLSVFPFADFDGGVFVTAGDLTGDGRADLVVTPDEGGGPRVQIFRGGDFAPVVSFFGIQDPNFRGGVRAAVGDINKDGFADLAVAAGFGGGPRVALWDGKALANVEFRTLVNDFFVFDTSLRNGTYVAIGDLDGDGFGDLVAGAGPGGGPRVLTLSGKTLLTAGPGAAIGGGDSVLAGGPITNFFAGSPANRGGVRVAVENLDGDLKADLVVGDGDGAGSHVTAYLGKSFVGGIAPEYFGFDAYPGFLGGVYVG